MNNSLLVSASTALFIGSIALASPAAAQSLKTAKICNDEYSSQKPALKAAHETKKDFVAACRALPVGQPT